MTAGSALLLSLKPRFADAVFAGTKRFELRRVRPRVTAGDLVLVYVTVPRCNLEGAFEVAQVVALPPARLWPRVRDKAGLTKAEFDAYFAGAEMAYAIEVQKTWKIAPVALSKMRKLQLRPPQSYQYLDTPTLMRLWQPPKATT